MDLQAELARTLIDHHPLDTARVLEQLEPGDAWRAMQAFPPSRRTAVLEGFSPPFAAGVLLAADDAERRDLVRELPSEETADLLPYLPESVAEALLDALPQLHADEIRELEGFDEDTAGAVMSPDVTSLRSGATVADALTRLRRLAAVGRNVSYVYCVDDADRLVGVLLMRDLVLSGPDTPLERIMRRDVARVELDEPLDEVADLLLERKLLAVPVVDDADRLRGVVFATQLVSELHEEGFEAAQAMFGAGVDEHATSPAGLAIRKRLPWLSVNLATAFLAAAVVGAFDGVIAELTVLAAFLPVVAGQGGNAGAQALAVMLRSLALDDLGPRPPLRLILKEGWVGLVNGVATGVLAGAVAVVATGNLALGVVIATAMVANLVLAGVAGAAIPVLMARLGQDPAQSANILLTTVTDVVGFAAFLGLAVLARPWLLPG